MNSRRGFTLVEVLLALGLSALVLTILAMAIHVQLRASELGHRGVEEAQLARTILHRIARDLRGLVRYDATDLTSLVATTSSSSTTSGTSGVGTASPSSPSSSTSSSSSSSSDSSDSLVPTLVGTLTRLEVDVSHVATSEQYQEMLGYVEGTQDVERPSDMRTVAYFMAEEGLGIVSVNTLARHGLVRRDLDRSVTRWASDQGQIDQYEQGLEPIAPEVTAIEFRYYDGTEWQETWDSEEQEALPLAVEITLMVARKQPKAGFLGSSESDSFSSSEVDSIVYRLIVQLPAAKQTQSSSSSTSSEESGSSSTQTDTSSG